MKIRIAVETGDYEIYFYNYYGKKSTTGEGDKKGAEKIGEAIEQSNELIESAVHLADREGKDESLKMR